MKKRKAAAVLLLIYIMSLLSLGMSTVAAAEEYTECDVKISSRLWELLFGREDVAADTPGTVLLCPGGEVFGAKIRQKYITVGDAGDSKCLKSGDILLAANGIAIDSTDAVGRIVAESGGEPITLRIRRAGAELTERITPRLENGEWRLGIRLRDGAAGIGTVTFIDKKTGLFGGLGHAICDRDTGDVIEMQSGIATEVVLGGLKRGAVGSPGELTGVLTGEIKGELYKNCECGIFGILDPKDLDGLVEIAVAKKEEITEGKAEIISTVKNGKTAHFDIELHDIDLDASGNKCFKIKVTDEALIAISGGIVRGMSGSPIIQNGKLIGAVTHVLVGDPSEGYGIFIENMLSAAEMPQAKAS